MTGIKSQASVEYLIVIGIGLAILTTFILYSFYYTAGYNTSKIGSTLDLALNSLSNTVGYLGSQQTGSTLGFSFVSPGIDTATSYFCQNSIVLSSSGLQAAKSVAVNVVGELPTTEGQFTGEGESIVKNSQPTVAVTFDLPISFINTSYSINGSTLSYNIAFEASSGALVTGVSFSLYLYSLSGVFISVQNYTSETGLYGGTLSLPSGYSGFRVVVYSPQYNVMSASCFSPSETVPVTLTNLESSATPAPFQQELVVNSFTYSSYEANNLQNVQFSYPNGTIIPSWLESGNIATFDGQTGQYIGGTWKSSSVNPITVTAWIMYNGVNTGNWEGIAGLASSGTCPFEHLTLNGGVLILDNCANDGGNFQTDFSPPVGVWTFVAYVIDGKSVTVYMNNESQSFTATGIYNPSVNSFDIGTDGYAFGRPSFEGQISNVQVYSSALSANHIQTIYADGLGAQPLQNLNIAGWWLLAGDGNDSSGNGNNGVANNVNFTWSGSSSTATTYWLKLDGGIPANSQQIVDIHFYPKNYNMLNTVDTGEASQLSSTFGQYNSITNVMDSGLIYQIYYDATGTFNSASYQDSVYSALIGNGVSLGFAGMVSSTSPFTTPTTGTSQSTCKGVQPNTVVNYPDNNAGTFPNPPIANTAYSWIIKFIGFAQVNLTTVFGTESDDGNALGSSVLGGDSGGAYWLGGSSNPNNLISEWHTEGCTAYNSTSTNPGTYRLELDYFEDGGGANVALWSYNPISYYHAAYPPDGVMPVAAFPGV